MKNFVLVSWRVLAREKKELRGGDLLSPTWIVCARKQREEKLVPTLTHPNPRARQLYMGFGHKVLVHLGTSQRNDLQISLDF